VALATKRHLRASEDKFICFLLVSFPKLAVSLGDIESAFISKALVCVAVASWRSGLDMFLGASCS
jgi:hypothetical protein